MEISKMLRIQKQYIEKGIKRDFKFRFNFLANIITDFIFNYLKVLFIEVLYVFGDVTIVGFSLDEMKFIFGCSFMIISLYMTFVFFSHLNLPMKIQKRTLDYVLLKPMPLIFNISFNRFNLAGLGSMLYGIYLIITSFNKVNIKLNLVSICVFILSILCGFIMYLSISLILYSFSFWSLKGEGIIGIIAAMGDFTKYPHEMYPTVLQVILSTIFPIFFACIYPAENQLRNFNVYYLLLDIVVTIVMIFIANFMLKKGLSKYNN